MNTTFALSALALAAVAALLPAARQRLQLSAAKHPSLAGHSRIAKRVAAQVPGYSYGEDQFFSSDSAPATVQAQRRAGLLRLAEQFRQRFPCSTALTSETAVGLSDLQFTGSYRVPFQYSRLLREHLRMPAFVGNSAGVQVTDLDGNHFYGLTGSYGVNVVGHDF